MNGKNKTKVVYILGSGRSGTTIVNRILGQIQGFFPVGEIRQVWDRNIVNNRFCGCDQRFRECEVWQNIFNSAYGGFDGVDAQKMIRLRDSHVRTRHIPQLFLPNNRSRMIRSLDYYIRNTEKLYKAIANETDSNVIVDSSKYPTYAYTLSLIPSIDLYIIHIIRDPRAVAYSWQKSKHQPDGGSEHEMMANLSPTFTSGLWITWNLTGELLWRQGPVPYMRVRYEEFMKQPRMNTEKVVSFLNEKVSKWPFSSDKIIHMSKDHTVSGNPNRFQTGNVVLKLDEKWRSNIKNSHCRLVTFLTFPFLYRYGFRL